LVDLEELAIRVELDGEQVGRVEDARLLAEVLADALFLGEGISHRVVTSDEFWLHRRLRARRAKGSGAWRSSRTSTFAPASSSFFFITSESALDTASLTVEGAPSTRSFASFKPRPVSSRITLITVTFLSAGYSFSVTVNSVCSSTGAAAAAAPGAAATATGAAAVTPNFFSMSETSSRTWR